MNRAPFAPVLVARLADNPCLSRRLAGFYAQLRQLPEKQALQTEEAL